MDKKYFPCFHSSGNASPPAPIICVERFAWDGIFALEILDWNIPKAGRWMWAGKASQPACGFYLFLTKPWIRQENASKRAGSDGEEPP